METQPNPVPVSSAQKFGPNEQTREQRQALADQAAAINALDGRTAEPFALQLIDRYVAGELSLAEVIVEVKRVHKKRYQR